MFASSVSLSLSVSVSVSLTDFRNFREKINRGINFCKECVMVSSFLHYGHSFTYPTGISPFLLLLPVPLAHSVEVPVKILFIHQIGLFKKY